MLNMYKNLHFDLYKLSTIVVLEVCDKPKMKLDDEKWKL